MIVSARAHRLKRRWSQDEVARRTGLSRPAVSAIETGRVVPSVAAAMALAAAFDCRVEDLFQLKGSIRQATTAWAWPPTTDPCPFWRAALGNRVLLYPAEPTLAGVLPSDGARQAQNEAWHESFDPARTLVVAACDPAIGLFAAEMERTASVRVLPFVRSSRAALALLGDGLVHVAGLHLQDAGGPTGNEQAVRDVLGVGYTLVRVSRWQEGIALGSGLGFTSVSQALRAKLRWVGREEGSGARRCLDSILGRRPRPLGYDRIAHDHNGVAETIRSGWAEAGVCIRLAAASAGLQFLTVQEEDYDFCYRTDSEDDPRIQALLQVVRSRPFRTYLDELPGYDAAQTGELHRIAG
jgi:molybdate-binding protein/DNA-binding XRE family transcriptional regulator